MMVWNDEISVAAGAIFVVEPSSSSITGRSNICQGTLKQAKAVHQLSYAAGMALSATTTPIQ
jgi:hypothetical protein